MKSDKFRSIRARLIFLLSLSAMIGILLSSVTMFIYTFNAERDKSVRSLSQLAGIIKQNLIASVEFDDSQSAAGILQTFQLDPAINGAFVASHDDALFSSYTKPGIDHTQSQDTFFDIQKSNDMKKPFEYIDIAHIVVSKPIFSADEYIGSFTIVANTNSLKEIFIEQSIAHLLVAIVALAVVFLLALRLQRTFTSPILTLRSAMEDVSSGHSYDTRVETQRNDEFKSLYDGFNHMIDIINERTVELSKSLEVSDNLRKEADKAKEEAERLAAAAKQSAEMSEGLYELSKRMHDKQKVSELADEVTEYIARFLKLPVAALFVRNGDDLLRRKANYGYHQIENSPNSFAIGSGIIGQAAAESKPITITDIPDYAKVAFGFGGGGPKVITVYPLVYNKRVVGVLELGTFTEFSETQRDWIRQANNSISMALQSVIAIAEMKEIIHAEWDESYDVGVEEFNEQHQHWFSFVNALFDAITNKRGNKELGEVLSNLLDFTVMHFASEEEVMLKYGYPDFHSHKQKHDEFIKEINEIQEKFNAGSKSVSIEMLILLVNWLKTHIVKYDKNYGSFFSRKGMT